MDIVESEPERNAQRSAAERYSVRQNRDGERGENYTTEDTGVEKGKC